MSITNPIGRRFYEINSGQIAHYYNKIGLIPILDLCQTHKTANKLSTCFPIVLEKMSVAYTNIIFFET